MQKLDHATEKRSLTYWTYRSTFAENPYQTNDIHDNREKSGESRGSDAW